MIFFHRDLWDQRGMSRVIEEHGSWARLFDLSSPFHRAVQIYLT